MKDATDCHAIEPEENQAKKNKLEKSWPQFAQNRPAKSLSKPARENLLMIIRLLCC